MSKTIQNELMGLCGEEIVTGIISEVKESRVFYVLADDVRVPILDKCHLLFDMLINPVKLEKNLFNF